MRPARGTRPRRTKRGAGAGAAPDSVSASYQALKDRGSAGECILTECGEKCNIRILVISDPCEIERAPYPGVLHARRHAAAFSDSSATRSVASWVPPRSRRESCARRKNKGASCSQVAPIPP